MKRINTTLAIMLGIFSSGNSLCASDSSYPTSTSTETSTPIILSDEKEKPSQEAISLTNDDEQHSGRDPSAEYKEYVDKVDWEREKFFAVNFVPALTPSFVTKRYQEAMDTVGNTSQIFSSGSTSNQGNTLNQSDGKKFLLLKVKTAYRLPVTFKNGYLFSPPQVIKTLKEMGIDRNLVAHVDKNKFWMHSIKYLELPSSKLNNEENIFEQYFEETNNLIKLFKLRIKEDAFTLSGFRGVGKNVVTPISSGPVSSSSNFIKSSYLKDESTPEEGPIVIRIIAGLHYDTKGLPELLAPVESLDPTHTFTRLCNALQYGKITCRNPDDELHIAVRVAEKLQQNKDDTITPEVLETMDRLVVRQFNMLVLEKIKDNFVAARRPQNTGFDDPLVDEVF